MTSRLIMSLLEGRYGPLASENNTKGICKSIKLYLITVVVCMSSFSLGYSLQYSSPAIPQLVIPSAGKLQLSAGNTSLFAVS